MTQVPSDADQLVFLTRVQKILDEGQFVATYKFALLIALIEIAIERGDDSGAELKIRLDWLAEKFIELYWGHAREFCGTVLSQSSGQNVAIIHRIGTLQRSAANLAEARRLPQWRTAVSTIARIVQAMPLCRLQLLRSGQRDTFLYDEDVVEGAIRLKPGVAYCLRRFSSLLGALARNGWLREVRDNPRNAYAIGMTQSLESFLFGDERVPLGRVREVLLPLQQGKCFYCGRALTDAMHVDHFVPWALYPSNLGHNFVLADAACNADKSDLLADVGHLDRWRSRNEGAGTQLALGVRSSGPRGRLERKSRHRALGVRARAIDIGGRLGGQRQHPLPRVVVLLESPTSAKSHADLAQLPWSNRAHVGSCFPTHRTSSCAADLSRSPAPNIACA